MIILSKIFAVNQEVINNGKKITRVEKKYNYEKKGVFGQI